MEKRNVAIYPRVTKKNQVWLKEQRKRGASDASMIDALLSHARRHMTVSQLVKLGAIEAR